MRERCYECGRKESWRDWWRDRADRRRRAQEPQEVSIVSAAWVAAMMAELRPSSNGLRTPTD